MRGNGEPDFWYSSSTLMTTVSMSSGGMPMAWRTLARFCWEYSKVEGESVLAREKCETRRVHSEDLSSGFVPSWLSKRFTFSFRSTFSFSSACNLACNFNMRSRRREFSFSSSIDLSIRRRSSYNKFRDEPRTLSDFPPHLVRGSFVFSPDVGLNGVCRSTN